MNHKVKVSYEFNHLSKDYEGELVGFSVRSIERGNTQRTIPVAMIFDEGGELVVEPLIGDSSASDYVGKITRIKQRYHD